MTGKIRFQAKKLQRLLTMFPAVAVIGPRQCGKSTLVRTIGKGWKYFNPEKEQAPSKVNPNTKVISSAEDLDAIFNRPESQKKQSKFKERVLNILNSKLERLEQQLLIPGINDLEIQKLEDQILDLNIKITSITQES